MTSKMDKELLRKAVELSFFTHLFIFIFNCKIPKLKNEKVYSGNSKSNKFQKACHVQLCGDIRSFVTVVNALEIENNLPIIEHEQVDFDYHVNKSIDEFKLKYQSEIEMLMDHEDFPNLQQYCLKKKKKKKLKSKIENQLFSNLKDFENPSTSDSVTDTMMNTISDQSIMDLVNSIENFSEISEKGGTSTSAKRFEGSSSTTSSTFSHLDDTFDKIIRNLPSQTFVNSQVPQNNSRNLKSPSMKTPGKFLFNPVFISSTSTPAPLNRSDLIASNNTFRFEDSVAKSVFNNSDDESKEFFENSIKDI